MTPQQAIALTAFLEALRQMQSPLPADIQTELNEIGNKLATDLNAIASLDPLAERYPPLDELYQNEKTKLLDTAGERNKGLPPHPLPTESHKELINGAKDSFSAADSVAAAKPNLLQKIWQRFNG